MVDVLGAGFTPPRRSIIEKDYLIKITMINSLHIKNLSVYGGYKDDDIEITIDGDYGQTVTYYEYINQDEIKELIEFLQKHLKKEIEISELNK